VNIRNISDYIADDIERLGELFNVYRTLGEKDSQKTRDLLHSYMAGVRRHIQWEEKILFPLLEARLGLENRGPAGRLREEHREIESLVRAIHDRVIKKRLEARDEEADLIAIMDAHNESARAGLYSMLDQSLNDAEKLKAYKSMKEAPLPSGNPCCEQA
jgi:hemerythrin-like domain-containing protein